MSKAYKVTLHCTNINYKFVLEENVTKILGRDNAVPNFSEDKKVSRQQWEVVLRKEDEGELCVLAKRVGVNPSMVWLAGTPHTDSIKEVAEQNKLYTLRDGDKFSIIANSYYYKVVVKEKKIEGDMSNWTNFMFYKNAIPSKPDGDLISLIHSNWFDNVSLLEYHHGYIQWLFPLFLDSGMNSLAKKLKKFEAKAMRNDLEVARRIIMSYRLMLNFYGMKLVNELTGEIARHDDKSFCAHRYQNLNSNFHNNLRISRIIISLGHLGFSRYKKPLIKFLEQEIEQNGKLQRCANSLENHWKPMVYDVGSKAYYEKTREDEEDREESIFFKLLEEDKNNRNNKKN